MDTRLTITQGMWRSLIAAIVALALVMALGASSASAASPPACRVQDTDSGKTYQALQVAVDAARRGDRLTVKGTCVGKTVIDRNVVLVGVQGPGSGKPTLTGVRKSLVIVVTDGARVKLRDLKIVRGATADGGCIINRGNLVLRDVVVHYCYPTDGIGPFGGAHNLGKLTLNGQSRINRSGPGGVLNEGVLVLNGQSSIYGNGTEYGAAGATNLGTLVMNGSSSISHNGGQYTGGVDNFGTMTMNDASSIEGNGSDGEYGYASGGVYNGVTGPRRWPGLRRVHRGVLTMNDTSSIRGNESWNGVGGGLTNAGGEVRMNDAASISGNSAGGEGGGVMVEQGRFTMNDASSIHGNTTRWSGGGLVLAAGRFFMNDASTISGNVAPKVGEATNEDGGFVGGGGGGGLVLGGGALHGVDCGPGGNVTGNSPDDCYVEP